MAWLVRNPKGRFTIYFAALCAFALGFVLYQHALAAPYATPFWANISPSQESPVGAVAERAMVCESGNARAAGGSLSVDARTGEVYYDLFLFNTPGVLEDNVFSLRWRSMVDGPSQLGNGVVPSWETTAQYVLLNGGDPNGPNGNAVDIRRPSGRIDRFLWNGVGYVAPSGVFDSLTMVSGNYRLTDKWGNQVNFDTAGMPATFVDRNGNTDSLSYTAYKLTGLTDERGKSYTIIHNINNYVSSITDPAGRGWSFGYDSAGNLTTVTTPTTPDQVSGITVTLGYDGAGRLTSVTDGRSNTVWGVGYSGSSRQASTVTIAGNTISYSYGSGQTDRTDRRSIVHRFLHSGTQVTKTSIWDPMLLVEKYPTLFYYSGALPSYSVLPRGNRVDDTYDSVGNLTARRQRTQNTSTNDSSDIVRQWGYTSNFVTSHTDPLGNQTTYGRSSAGNLTSVTHPAVTSPASQTASESFTYNSKGQPTRHTNEEGKHTDFAYFSTGTSSDLLQQVTVDVGGLAIARGFTYDSAGNIATETDPEGHATSYTWDSLRRLTQTQAPTPLSYRVQHHYDGNSNPTTTDVENIDKDGNVVSGNQWFTTTRTWTTTDDLATLVEEIDASTTRTTSLEYDANENLMRVIKPEGNKVKFNYNDRDLVANKITGETASGASTEEYTYDDNGNLTVREDGRDNDWTSTYDLFDRNTRDTDPLGNYTERQFDKNDRVTNVALKNSADTELQRESYYFDERGRQWKTSALFKDPSQAYSDAVTTVERLKTGQVKTVTNPRGKSTTNTYDGAGRLTGSTDAMGNSISYTLDADGHPTACTLTEKDGTTNISHGYEATYDEVGRLLTRVEIDRTNSSNRLTTQNFYDSRSNLAFRIDASGNPTRWTFDGVGRMTKVERALTLGATINDFTAAEMTQWGFDKNGRLVSYKDDANNETTWAFDALDRLAAMSYPDSTTVSHQYDLNGNVTQTTDPAGNVVADTFDVANRNTSRSITLATGVLGTTSETRTFDGIGRMVTNEDNDYKLEFSYAVIGLRSFPYTETQSYVGSTAYAKTVTKTYDANGNKSTEAYPSGANLSLAYSWNDIDNLASITDGTSTIVSDAWIGARRKTETFQSGAKRTNYYTGFRAEIESVRHETGASATILRLDYGYNAMHDRLYERFGASGSPGDAFEYDKLQRLTVAWMGSTTPSSPSGNPYVTKIQYNCNDDGNRTSVVTTSYQQAPQTASYATNSVDEYTSVGGTTHAWDARGNLIDNGTQLFAYDYECHLVQVKLKASGAVVSTYRYDPMGRRVEKDLGGTVERYVYSTSSVVEDQSYVVTTYGGSDTWKQSFVWADEPDSGIRALEQSDVLDHDSDGNTTEITRSFYHRDVLGSVMEITDINQVVLVSYRYDAYGNMTILRGGVPQSTDPLGQHWSFNAGFADAETGLIYDNGQYYSPSLGSLISRAVIPGFFCADDDEDGPGGVVGDGDDDPPRERRTTADPPKPPWANGCKHCWHTETSEYRFRRWEYGKHVPLGTKEVSITIASVKSKTWVTDGFEKLNLELSSGIKIPFTETGSKSSVQWYESVETSTATSKTYTVTMRFKIAKYQARWRYVWWHEKRFHNWCCQCNASYDTAIVGPDLPGRWRYGRIFYNIEYLGTDGDTEEERESNKRYNSMHVSGEALGRWEAAAQEGRLTIVERTDK